MGKPICIATLGTSLTYDGVYESGGEWQGLVQVGLRAGTSRPVTVYNFGVASQDSNQRIAQLQAGMWLPYRPEIIIVEFSINDAYTPRSITPAQCKANALTIINMFKAQDPNVKAFVMTMNPCVPGSGPALDRPNLPLYTAKYREIAAENPDIGLIDNEPDWGTPTFTQLTDGIHPTRAAETPIIAPNIIEAVLPFIN
ncbi:MULTISPECIES: SGNH/GDSL hydrolase family protein [unclassified Sinorhizobium]|uniref:SGNH/GDSL hydrolase family protein n=1 Tax=unclassified Sinorhizobium TaxID=2613772 RepID=UPI0035252B4F